MSLRVDSTPLISNSLIVGDSGLGVLAENIPSTGTNGPGYVYDSLDLPADNGKEIIGRIVTEPILGEFFAYEDTSFQLLDAPDGIHTFTFDVYEDGVFVPPTSTATITIGAGETVVNATTGASALTAFDANIISGGGTTVIAELGTSSASAFDATIIHNAPVVVSATLATSGLTAFNATITTGEFFPLKQGRNVLVLKQQRMVTVL